MAIKLIGSRIRKIGRQTLRALNSCESSYYLAEEIEIMATQSVAELCEQHKLTVEQLADQTGLDAGRITAIILGRWTPSPNERQKIATVLDVTPADITWGHKTPIQHIYGTGPG